MNECSLHRRMRAIGERRPALVVGRGYDLGPQSPRGFELGSRRGLDDQHLAGNAGLARCQCDSLGGVARADGPHAAATLLFGQ